MEIIEHLQSVQNRQLSSVLAQFSHLYPCMWKDVHATLMWFSSFSHHEPHVMRLMNSFRSSDNEWTSLPSISMAFIDLFHPLPDVHAKTCFKPSRHLVPFLE